MKNIKQTLRNGLIGVLGLVAASTPSFAQERTIDTNVRVQDEQTILRTNTTVQDVTKGIDVTVGVYNKRFEDKDKIGEKSGYLLLSVPVDSTKTVGYWARAVKGESDKIQTGLDLTIADGSNSHYICPVWYSAITDLSGRTRNELLACAIGTQELSDKLTLDYGVLEDVHQDEKPTNAAYAIVRSNRLGAGIGKDYDNQLRPTAGFTAGNFGGLVYSIHNLDNGEFYVKTSLAQNPTKIPGPEGQKVVADVLTLDSYLPETNPFISGIPGKSKKGLALELQRSTQNGSDYTIVEPGYNLGNGFGFSVGRKFGFDQHNLAKFIYKARKLYGELRLAQGKEAELYLATTGINF